MFSQLDGDWSGSLTHKRVGEPDLTEITLCQVSLPVGRWQGGGFAGQRTLPWTQTWCYVFFLCLVKLLAALSLHVGKCHKMHTAAPGTFFQE